VLAAIPYETFPEIELGPLTLRTFGLMVALGVLIGAWIAARYAERFGVPRDETYRVATWMVLAGIIGSRLTWAATHTDQIENPVDVIAIWEGGIQFSGGFIAALLVGLPFFKKWRKVLRWQVLDGYALGLSIGLALGRVGCYAVGEHFGSETNFFLASRWEGGVPPDVREPTLDGVPIVDGTTFHNTSLYEFLYMMVLFGILGGLVLLARRRGREVAPGTLVGVFIVYYGVLRLLSDAVRVNDEQVAGLTGAQWMCIVMIPAGIWILWKVRPRIAALAAEEQSAKAAVAAPDEVEAPDDPETADAGTDAADVDDGDADDDGGVDRDRDDHEDAGDAAGDAVGTDDEPESAPAGPPAASGGAGSG
jgi:phosphatidylglycerol---prolipoprotein diacylglyceryl transferase